jgi:phosphate starvation-inducible PhoH-like protein
MFTVSDSFSRKSFIHMKIKKGLLRESIDNVKSVIMSENQQKYYDVLNNKNISLVFGLGPAGCGKTMLACNAAVDSLKGKMVDKIIITRPIVSVDEDLGFLPGTFEAKMDPWIRPIFDILRESFTAVQIQTMMDNGLIEISPLAYMRGRTFKNAFIIADEMQNSSPNQMKMMLTRIGEGSKMVITGDLLQSDRPGENGLSDFISRYKGSVSEKDDSREISVIKLERIDIRRSSIVSKIIDIYEPVVKPFIKPVISTKKNNISNGSDDCAMIPKSYLK